MTKDEKHGKYSDKAVGEENPFMKMHDALTYVRHLLCHIGSSDSDPVKREAYELVCNTLASVSKRNCDIGTADEQYERWERFCQILNSPLNKDSSCFGCPVYDRLRSGSRASCELIWGNLPYEEDKKECV